MNEFGHPDSEILAAFVDGRLPGEERVAVVAHLDRCRDCYEVFAGTVRFQAEEEPRGRVLRPGRFGAGTPGRRVWWAAAAAAVFLAAAIALPVLWLESERRSPPGPPGAVPLLASAELAAALAVEDRAVPAAAWEGWPDGLGFAPALDRETVSFRAGVRLMDLAAAARAGDAGGAGAALADLRGVLESGGAADELEGSVARARRAAARSDFAALDAAAAELEAGAESLLDPFHLGLGKWAEAGRLAAAAGDRGFFASPVFAGFLEEAEGRALEAPVQRALDRIAEGVRGEAAPGEELESAFAGLIGAFR